jgi:hypothetical protein
MSAATPDLYFHKREVMIEEYEKAKVNKALGDAIFQQRRQQFRVLGQTS